MAAIASVRMSEGADEPLSSPTWLVGARLVPATASELDLAVAAYCEVSTEMAVTIAEIKTHHDIKPGVKYADAPLSKRAIVAEQGRQASAKAFPADAATLQSDLEYEHDPRAILSWSPVQVISRLHDYNLSDQLVAAGNIQSARVSKVQHKFLQFVSYHEWMVTGDYGITGIFSSSGIRLALKALSAVPSGSSNAHRRVQLVPLKTLVSSTVGSYASTPNMWGAPRRQFVIDDSTFGQQLMFQPIALFRLDGIADGAASSLFAGGRSPSISVQAAARTAYMDGVEQSCGALVCLRGPYYVDVFDLGPRWREVVDGFQAAEHKQVKGNAGGAKPRVPQAALDAGAEASDASGASSGTRAAAAPLDSLPYTYLTPRILSNLLKASTSRLPAGYASSCNASLGGDNHTLFAGLCRSRPEAPITALKDSWQEQASAEEASHLMSPLSTTAVLGATRIPDWFKYQSVQLREGEVLLLPPRYLVRLARNEQKDAAAQLYIARTTSTRANGESDWRDIVPNAHSCIACCEETDTGSTARGTSSASNTVFSRHGYPVTKLPARRSQAFQQRLSYAWIGLHPKSDSCECVENGRPVEDMLSKLPLFLRDRNRHRDLPAECAQALDGEFLLQSISPPASKPAAETSMPMPVKYASDATEAATAAAAQANLPIWGSKAFLSQQPAGITAKLLDRVPKAAAHATSGISQRSRRPFPWRLELVHGEAGGTSEAISSSTLPTFGLVIPSDVWNAFSLLPDDSYSELRGALRNVVSFLGRTLLHQNSSVRSATISSFSSACASLAGSARDSATSSIELLEGTSPSAHVMATNQVFDRPPVKRPRAGDFPFSPAKVKRRASHPDSLLELPHVADISSPKAQENCGGCASSAPSGCYSLEKEEAIDAMVPHQQPAWPILSLDAQCCSV